MRSAGCWPLADLRTNSSRSAGSSLMLLGLIDRPTRDLDVIALIGDGRYVKANTLPRPLTQAVAEVGEVFQLGPAWNNAGPADLLDFGLPPGFADRTEIRRYESLTLHIASRVDQVAFKLYATADQGPRSGALGVANADTLL